MTVMYHNGVTTSDVAWFDYVNLAEYDMPNQDKDPKCTDQHLQGGLTSWNSPLISKL